MIDKTTPQETAQPEPVLNTYVMKRALDGIIAATGQIKSVAEPDTRGQGV